MSCLAAVFLPSPVMLTLHDALCRHVMLPKDIAKRVPKTHLMSETEWRNLGVQQSQGWIHYMIHQPGTLSDVSTNAQYSRKSEVLLNTAA